MIENNFFTLIIINIKDNFPLEKKTLARDFRHIPVFHKGTILTCEGSLITSYNHYVPKAKLILVKHIQSKVDSLRLKSIS